MITPAIESVGSREPHAAPADRSSESEPPLVVVVEDNEEDRWIIKRVFSETDRAINLRFLEDGAEALDYVHRRGRFGDPSASLAPAVFIVDLYLPHAPGTEVVRAIQAAEHLQSSSIVMFTHSRSNVDLTEASELRINHYAMKPDSMAGWSGFIQKLCNFWIRREPVRIAPPGSPLSD